MENPASNPSKEARLFGIQLIRRRVAQFIARFWTIVFSFSARFERYDGEVNSNVVVSLTSYGRRIGWVHLTLRSILRGSVRPASLSLVVHEVDAHRVVANKQLVELIECGEVNLITSEQDFRSYKKIIYSDQILQAAAARSGRRPAYLVIVDDDVIYPRLLLQNLLPEEGLDALHRDTVSCAYARIIPTDRTLPYSAWPIAEPGDSGAMVLPIGVGGVCYPADILDGYSSWDLISRLAPTADDLWLKRVADIKGMRFRCVKTGYGHPLSHWGEYAEPGLFTDNRRENAEIWRNLLESLD